ncbi:hypothetical protein [Bdellovibrio sp. HCB2-146]|uniref:hypothetical protein n=1 Tax=Bdellovibrio sp. HCB2-146 TaxID=3394362 RepID=UPI0039BD11EF
MKYLLAIVSMFVGTSAWATQKECSIKHTLAGKQTESIVKLVVDVKEGTDLASYLFDGVVGSINVFVREVDGNFFVVLKAGNSKVSTQAVDEVHVSFHHDNESIDMTCY